MQTFLRVVSLVAVLVLGVAAPSTAQPASLDVGVRLQKTVGLYYENGVSLQYADDRARPRQLFVGFTYVTSRLGSALASNAVKQDNLLVSISWYLRPSRAVQPFGRFNTGFFKADYESPIFEDLQNTSLILSPEFGVAMAFDLPLKVTASTGFNLITGDGVSGAGTLYPLFVQVTTSWDVLR